MVDVLVIHFQETPACGNGGSFPVTTDTAAEVTCGLCQATERHRTAARQVRR